MAPKSPKGSSFWEAPVAIAIVLLRLFTVDPSRLWRDWILVLAVYWLFHAFKSRSPAWPMVTVTTMAYLLGIHFLGLLPHALTVLGMGAK